MKAVASGMRMSGITAIGLDSLDLAGAQLEGQVSKDKAKMYTEVHGILTRALRQTFPDFDLQVLMGAISETRRKAKRKEIQDSEPIGAGAED